MLNRIGLPSTFPGVMAPDILAFAETGMDELILWLCVPGQGQLERFTELVTKLPFRFEKSARRWL
jgi:hypothetical protein